MSSRARIFDYFSVVRVLSLRVTKHRIFDPLRGRQALDPMYRLVTRLIFACRRPMGRFCGLPDFLIIGAGKSGTSSLFDYLSQHPQILPSIQKEIHYFSRRYHKSIDWYRAHFPLRGRLVEGRITGEASPGYLGHPEAPKRIKQVCPGIRLIAILRNPTQRVISRYFHDKRFNRDGEMDLEQWLEREAGTVSSSGDLNSSRLVNGGLYKMHLERYLGHFPRENLHVIISENMFQNPGPEVRRLFAFLGVDESFVPADLSPKNIGLPKKDVPSGTIERLDRLFAPYNAQLAAFLGEDLPW